MLVDVGLLSGDDGTGNKARAADDDNARFAGFGQSFFGVLMDGAIARTRIDNAFYTSFDGGVDKQCIVISRAVDDFDIGELVEF